MCRNFSKVCESINNVIVFIEKIILTLLLATLILSIFFQVVARYVLLIPTPWSEELARYCFIYLCWIGSAYAIYTGRHIDITIIDSLLKKTKRPALSTAIVNKIGLIITICFLLYFIHFYGDYITKIRGTKQVTTALRLHFSVPITGVYIGAILTVIQGVLALFKPVEVPESPAEVEMEFNEPDND